MLVAVLVNVSELPISKRTVGHTLLARLQNRCGPESNWRRLGRVLNPVVRGKSQHPVMRMSNYLIGFFGFHFSLLYLRRFELIII